MTVEFSLKFLRISIRIQVGNGGLANHTVANPSDDRGIFQEFQSEFRLEIAALANPSAQMTVEFSLKFSRISIRIQVRNGGLAT